MTLKSRLVGLIMLVAAVLLLIWSVPRTLSAFMMVPSASVLRKLQNLQSVETADLETLIASQRRGMTWSNRGRTLTDLGLAQLLIAERLVDNDAVWREQTEEAIKSLKAGLAIAPANPYAWTRLAYGEFRLRGWSPLALSALRLAFITAPYDPRLLMSRLRLSFLAWPHMTPEDEDLVLQQIRYAWEQDPNELTQIAVGFDQTNLVRAALLRRPDDLSAFEERVKNQKPS